MARIIKPGKAVATGAGLFAGVYRCDRCGAVIELDSDDVGYAWSHGDTVEDYDGKGKRIRMIPHGHSGGGGCPSCGHDAWLWEHPDPER